MLVAPHCNVCAWLGKPITPNISTATVKPIVSFCIGASPVRNCFRANEHSSAVEALILIKTEYRSAQVPVAAGFLQPRIELLGSRRSPQFDAFVTEWFYWTAVFSRVVADTAAVTVQKAI